MRRKRLVRAAFCTALMLVFSSSSSLAANWLLESSAELSSVYNDNLRLVTDRQEALWGRHLNVNMVASGATPKSDIRLEPRYRLSRYSSDTQADNDEAAMDMTTRLREERTISALSIDWRRDTTLTSELEDTGFVQSTKYRTVHGAHPSIQYEATERVSGLLRWDYTDVSYEDARLTFLTDYNIKALTGSLSYMRTERDSIQTDLYGSRLNAPNIGNQVMDIGVRASLTHAFYERSYGTFTIGMHRVESSQELPGADLRSMERGFLGNVTLSQERGRTSWKAFLQRTVDPSGYGQLVQNDRFELNATERLNAYWSFTLRALYVENDALQSTQIFDSRRYLRLSSHLAWSPLEAWRISLRYVFHRQKYASAERYAQANELGADISYRFDKKTLYP